MLPQFVLPVPHADDGELDWKVIAISSDDPKAASVNDVEDVERYACLFLISCIHPFNTCKPHSSHLIRCPSNWYCLAELGNTHSDI